MISSWFFMISSWFPFDFLMVSFWFPSDFLLISVSFPLPDFRRISLRFLWDFLKISLKFSYDFLLISLSFLCGFLLIFLWFPFGALWLSCEFLMVWGGAWLGHSGEFGWSGVLSHFLGSLKDQPSRRFVFSSVQPFSLSRKSQNDVSGTRTSAAKRPAWTHQPDLHLEPKWLRWFRVCVSRRAPPCAKMTWGLNFCTKSTIITSQVRGGILQDSFQAEPVWDGAWLGHSGEFGWSGVLSHFLGSLKDQPSRRFVFSSVQPFSLSRKSQNDVSGTRTSAAKRPAWPHQPDLYLEPKWLR